MRVLTWRAIRGRPYGPVAARQGAAPATQEQFHRWLTMAGPAFAVFQGTSNGGRQFLSNRRSNRHNVPLHGKSDRIFTQGRKFAHR